MGGRVYRMHAGAIAMILLAAAAVCHGTELGVAFQIDDDGIVQGVTAEGHASTFERGVNYSTFSISFGGPSFNLSWTLPAVVGTDDLPTAFQPLFNGTTIFANASRVADGVYSAPYLNRDPLHAVFGVVFGVTFMCEDVFPFTPADGSWECFPFNATSLAIDPSASLFAVRGPSPALSGDAGAFVFSVEVSQNASLPAALSAGLPWALAVSTASLRMSSFADLNDERHEVSTNMLIGMLTAASVCMACLMLMLAPLSAWLMPFVRDRHGWNVVIHLVIALVVLAAASVGAGLLGWIGAGVLFSLLIFAFWVTYLCKRELPKARDEYEMTSMSMSHFAPPPEELGKFTRRPSPLGRGASTMAFSGLAIFLLSAGAFLAVFFIWSVPNYYVVERTTGTYLVEVQPVAVSKSTLALYAFDGAASLIRANYFLQFATDRCGEMYRRDLTDAEKDALIKGSYIDTYGIDMTQFDPSDYRAYASLNAWFIRPLVAGSRYVDGPLDDAVVASPADARVFAFAEMPPDQTTIIKEEPFTISAAFGDDPAWAAKFSNASMIILRLAPQDYHRFHAPVAGTVVYHEASAGTIYSVNADAVASNNRVLLDNKREAVVVQTSDGRYVGMVAIGATCVGSIEFVVPRADGSLQGSLVNANVTKGQEAGNFQFGGSTVILLLPNESFEVSKDIVENTSRRVETYLHVGTRIATAI